MPLGTKNLFEFTGVIEFKGLGQGSVTGVVAAVSAGTPTLLLETGDRLLLETGTDALLLE